MSNFNMADINIYEPDSLMVTPTFKSNAGDKKVSPTPTPANKFSNTLPKENNNYAGK